MRQVPMTDNRSFFTVVLHDPNNEYTTWYVRAVSPEEAIREAMLEDFSSVEYDPDEAPQFIASDYGVCAVFRGRPLLEYGRNDRKKNNKVPRAVREPLRILAAAHSARGSSAPRCRWSDV